MPASKDWPHKNPNPIDDEPAYREPLWDRVPLLYIPATRVGLPSKPVGWWEKEQSEHLEATKELENQAKVASLLGMDSDTDPVIFNPERLKETIDSLWLGYSRDKQKQQRLGYALHLGYSCAKTICSEIVTGYSTHPYVEWTDDEMVHADDVLSHPNVGITTSDGISGTALYLGGLSAGTQGTLLWIWALVLKIAIHYDFEEGWEKEPAILLIDEIENHLHPTWQRRVIPTLLKKFPRLQIFATTHSPFLVAGLKAGQVHLLKRYSTGILTASTNSEDIIGWTMDEILRAMMGVEDPTDEGTASAARELRELRKEGPREDERAEVQRQRRMEELRQRVNRELLAGGPEAAQREEFEQQFAEALQRYQESQSLSQDSG